MSKFLAKMERHVIAFGQNVIGNAVMARRHKMSSDGRACRPKILPDNIFGRHVVGDKTTSLKTTKRWCPRWDNIQMTCRPNDNVARNVVHVWLSGVALSWILVVSPLSAPKKISSPPQSDSLPHSSCKSQHRDDMLSQRQCCEKCRACMNSGCKSHLSAHKKIYSPP